jgi:hypothetical protein
LTHLIAETDADAEHDAAEDEHREVHGCHIEDCAD